MQDSAIYGSFICLQALKEQGFKRSEEEEERKNGTDQKVFGGVRY